MAFSKIRRVGLLGCTGVVGQRFLQQLERHPCLKVVSLAASERSAGKSYEEATSWRLQTPMPETFKRLEVKNCTVEDMGDVDLVFSALDTGPAKALEPLLNAAGIPVFSNASAQRMVKDVPILIPDVNADHLEVVKQQKYFSKGGYSVTNANCSTTGLTIALEPIRRAFGIEKIFVVTLQALSGAGVPGVPSLDAIDNIIPYIGGEEDKLETETQKIFGKIGKGCEHDFDIKVSAHTNRVPILDGHTACVSFTTKTPSATVEQIKQVLRDFKSPVQLLKLPSGPESPVKYFEQDNRPQARLDRDVGRGYTVSVGRVRPCKLFQFRLVCLSHNTVIGAAGGSVLNAELAMAKGYL
eukprot:gb/GEZN01009858.1/.p1 GENE.gb/GEZN01009858.1/~~gb/GEZN01009858.1/.p1  ORF type:complete len:364 (-),score=49.10 gb/GEZN01009858.1/:197-1258(-)